MEDDGVGGWDDEVWFEGGGGSVRKGFGVVGWSGLMMMGGFAADVFMSEREMGLMGGDFLHYWTIIEHQLDVA